MLAQAIAGELGLPFFNASGPALVGSLSGESEERVRAIFEEAVKHAPSCVFVDMLDVIAAKKESSSSQRGMDRRIIAQLCDSIDMIANANNPQLELAEASTNESSAEGGGEVGPDSVKGTKPVPSTKTVILIAATNK
jgi:ribosome biogenesis ATPase